MAVSSPLAKKALDHLNRIKPYDGWSLHSYKGSDGKSLLILRRRNIPLSDSGFEDIVYDPRTDNVLGILQSSSSSSSCGTKRKGVILIERGGVISRRKQVIDVEIARETSNSTESSSMSGSVSGISSEQNKQILQYGGGIILSAILLNAFSDAIQLLSLSLSVLLIPFLIIASMACPDISTFDAKKELKRVFRGQHLPENHPEKPKGWFAETTARVAATVAGELATGLGYEVTHMPLICAIFTTVKLNSLDTECYWIGAFNKWYFIMQRKLDTTTATQQSHARSY